MILIQLNKEDFEYDIHSLVKAFYPSENVSVCTVLKETDEPVSIIINVEYQSDKIFLALTDSSADAVEGRETGNRMQKLAFPADYSDRRGTKNVLKKNLYQMLSAYTGKTLPWGTLTGIRPTKIPMTMLEKGEDISAIERFMKETYGTSKEKTDLSIEIARRERNLLNRLDYEKGYSLYIGIPFCPGTCLYCSFTSYPLSAWKERIDAYLDALEKEMSYTAQRFAGRHLNSIYIGGGTPTTLLPYQLDRLITNIEKKFDLSSLLEFTVEAGRPDSIDKDKLETLRAHGISRISINPQTMKQETLDLIGRKHTVAQTVESFHLARSLGFDNINMDLIMGLPQETLADVKHTMDMLKTLEPDSITVHSLALKRASKLQMFKEDYAEWKIVNTQEHLDTAARACAQMGMTPYYLYRQKNMAGNFENTGYAKEGKAGIYNILIMEEKQTIMALGAGAISKIVRNPKPGRQIESECHAAENDMGASPDHHPKNQRDIQRVANVKEVSQYIDRIDEMIQRKENLIQNQEDFDNGTS